MISNVSEGPAASLFRSRNFYVSQMQNIRFSYIIFSCEVGGSDDGADVGSCLWGL